MADERDEIQGTADDRLGTRPRPGTAYNEGEQLDVHPEGARRLTLDQQDEFTLERPGGDGRQMVVQPPVGTVGGPTKPPGDPVTTTQHRTIPSGGGPADPREMPADVGGGSTQNVHGATDDGMGTGGGETPTSGR